MEKHTKALSAMLLLVLQIFAGRVLGECNTCSVVNNMACVSNTKFQVCINGSPTGPINSCPSDHVCSNTDAFICKPDSGTVVVGCSDCGKCDTSRTFACTGLHTYALCLGTTAPVGTEASCGNDLVCSIDHPQICGSPNLGVSATCPSSLDTTTTTTTTTSTSTSSTISSSSTDTSSTVTSSPSTVSTSSTSTSSPVTSSSSTVSTHSTDTSSSVTSSPSTVSTSSTETSSPVTSSSSTVSTSSTSTSTSSPVPSNPLQFCQQQAQTGRFPAGNSISTTCKQYFYCFVSGGSWRGQLYTCAGRTYFDSSSQICNTAIPARCV